MFVEMGSVAWSAENGAPPLDWPPPSDSGTQTTPFTSKAQSKGNKIPNARRRDSGREGLADSRACDDTTVLEGEDLQTRATVAHGSRCLAGCP